MMKSRLSSICFMFICTELLISFGTPTYAWDNGLARTPKMGWNAWCVLTTNINEANLKQMADSVVSSGLRDAGYIWFEGLCDGWQSSNTLNPDGSQKEDSGKFPSGIKSLVDYIHSKGLKMEISSSPGAQNCSLRQGSYGHEQQDANKFAEWGIDGLYYDECSFQPGSKEEEIAAYTLMRDCILRSGRPMVYEISNYGGNSVWEWGDSVGNYWRTAGDGRGYTGSKYDQIVDSLYKYAGPGHWNAPESNVPDASEKASFSLNCILAASLDIVVDFRNMTQAARDRITMFTNKEAIAVNQDRLGIAGRRVKTINNVDIIARPLINGCTAVLFFNRGTAAANITVNWSDIGLLPVTSMKVFDIWANSNKGTFSGSYTANVPVKDVVMIKLSPVSWTLDTSSPSKINDLIVSSKSRDTMTLSWSAPGNNGISGTAFEYSIRSAEFPITDANWETASICGGFSPKEPYSHETFTAHGRKPNIKYYFAIRTADEVGNWSDVSINAEGTITKK